MSTDTQALVEVQQALPVPQTRFDQFLLKAHELAATAKLECDEALTHTIESEATYQVVDVLMTSFKKKAKEIHDERLGLTRPIDDFKQTFVDAENESVLLYDTAVTILQERMSAYRLQKKMEAKQAQLDAERELERTRANLERNAERLTEKAATLKTESARERALSEAEAFKQAALLTPASVSLVAAVPQAVASDVGEKWELKSLDNLSDFLRWLADHPEWHSLVRNPKTEKLSFPVGEMNRLARQCRDVVQVPGLTFHPVDQYRSKSS